VSTPERVMAGGAWPTTQRLLDRVLERSRTDSWADLLFVPVVLLALVVYLSFTNEYFLDPINLKNVFVQAAILAIAAFGVTFIILAAELDLSIGSGVSLVSVVSALVIVDTGSIAIGLLAGAGTGIALGVINGVVVTRLEVPSFIATFGTLVIANGIALALTDGGVVSGLPRSVGDLTKTEVLGVPTIVILMFAVFAVLLFIQNHTTFGVRVFAVGGNREAARLSGVPVDRIRFLCFLLSGVTVAVAGLALMSRVESGQPNAAQLLPLEAVAAIVVGGTSIFGGRGSVTKTLWGVLLIATIRNGLDLEGVNDDLKQVILGCVFIGAASVDFFRRQLGRRRRDKLAAVSQPVPSTAVRAGEIRPSTREGEATGR
jgi:ribose transport system permease protein